MNQIKHITIKIFHILGLLSVLMVFTTAKKDFVKTNYKEIYFKNHNYKLTAHQERFLWADSVLKRLSLEEKVGQVFMLPVYSNKSEKYYEKVENQLIKFHLGGIIFFQGDPISQANLTNRYQSKVKTPLLIGIDAEWGLGMRLDDAFSFPKAISMGASNDPELVKLCAEEMAYQCKRLGVHFNFAPDADVNTNPENPVINYRSFGSIPANVSMFSKAVVKGFSQHRILTSAKHFPGHGDTQDDSHKTMPVLKASKQKILLQDAYPFIELIKDSVPSIMVGHLNAPALDPRPNVPASISAPIIKGFLKGELLYGGLVISDALNMRGLINKYPTGVAEVKAFQAGNDILLQTADIDIAYPALLAKIKSGGIPIADLDYSVRKILMAKKWAELFDKKQEVKIDSLIEDINRPYAHLLKQELFEKATTIIKNEDNILPIISQKHSDIATLSIAGKADNIFQQKTGVYGNTVNYIIPFKPSEKVTYQNILNQVVNHKLVIATIHQTHNSDSRDFGINPETIEILTEIQKKTKLVVIVFGNPYAMRLFKNFNNIVCAYEDQKEAHAAAADVIFGFKSANGRLPVETKSLALNQKTIFYNKTTEGNLTDPAYLGLDEIKLSKIRHIVDESIASGEFPGCQILIARKGKVAYYQSFGYQDYSRTKPIKSNTIYDLASITKVSATLQAIMHLYDNGKLDLDQNLGLYLPEAKGTDKENISIRSLLLHEAGLKSFIPFYTYTNSSAQAGYQNLWFSTSPKNTYLKVSQNLFVSPTIKDSVLQWVLKSPLLEHRRHVYSDLGMILLQHVIEKISGMGLEAYCQRHIYEPMGLYSTFFNASERSSIDKIAPTEFERVFRGSQVHGTVHDPNAALLGGVAGHAGLFSSAWELSKILQMNLNRGTYNNKRYISTATVDLFTKNQSDKSHRGLGWNKPLPDDGNVSEYASDQAYGHTGYTGTVAWVDPKYDLVFVFLSNRVYPTVNNKLIKNKTRKRIHDLVYEAIKDEIIL